MWGAVAVIIAPVLQRIVRDLERQSRRARVSNERVEKLFDDAPHGVALLDPSGSIIRVNISMAVLVGLDPPDMVGHRLGDFETPGEDQDRGPPRAADALAAASPCSPSATSATPAATTSACR